MNTARNASVVSVKCSGRPRPPSHKSCLYVCDIHKYQYNWHMTSWSKCKAKEGEKECQHSNIGYQQRNVTCVSKCGVAASDEAICGSFRQKPPTWQHCELPCARDCVAREFQPWTDCQSCFTSHRSRSRTVLAAARYGGKPCSDVTELKACHHDSTCLELRHTNFQYRLGNWSECFEIRSKLPKRLSRVLSRINNVAGLQRRDVGCSDVNGRDVNMT